MSEDRPTGFMAALQLADSFFPTGMYAHSHGLEGMVTQGSVNTAGDVEEFLKNQMVCSVLPSDGVALINAYRSAGIGDLDTLVSIDRLLLALKLPQEQRTASVQVGQRLMAETSNFISHPVHAEYRMRVSAREAPGNSSVALGVTACALGIPESQALLLFCHSHAVSVVGAAMRLLPLSHTNAQSILHRLRPVIVETARDVRKTHWKDMTAFTPEIDIASMRHEEQDLRLFAS
jgi:urease accessory protein